MPGNDADNLVALMTSAIEQLDFDGEFPASDMVELIRQGHSAATLAGAGRRDFIGRAREWVASLSPKLITFGKEDKRILSDAILEQLKYLRQFAADAEDMTPDAIRARARMYAGATRATYSKTRYSKLKLPAQPGVGTECLTNCRCYWEVNGKYARWIRTSDDSCSTCREREGKYRRVRV